MKGRGGQQAESLARPLPLALGLPALGLSHVPLCASLALLSCSRPSPRSSHIALLGISTAYVNQAALFRLECFEQLEILHLSGRSTVMTRGHLGFSWLRSHPPAMTGRGV